MAFGKKHPAGAGNAKRPKPPPATWQCGCKTTLSARILFCKKCGTGQKEGKT